jgi:hypothetical protein
MAGEAAEAGAFVQKFLGRPLAAGVNYACFARVYDAAHLAQHPRQNVRDMELLATIDAKDPTYYSLQLGLHFRKGKQFRTTGADCRAVGEGENATTVQCSAACEGGTVDIKLKDDGSVWLTFPNNGGIWSPNEPGDPVVKPTGLGKDDTLFRLDRAPGAQCVPLIDDKEAAAALARQR